tara:strand:+ start:266 stop:691 length:426 start_codon:yes stop_codon:yes gene_type:complete
MATSGEKALSASRTLAEELQRCADEEDVPDAEQYARWRKMAVLCNKTLAAQERRLDKLRAEHGIRLELMREAMRTELIDREGNAARVAEKQRLGIEQRLTSGEADALVDRCIQSVAVLENRLGLLSSLSTPAGEGCQPLAE